MSLKSNKFFLQIMVGLLALVPVCAGGYGVLAGPAGFADITFTSGFDSHFRYLSGLLLAIGYGFWSCIPNIEKKSQRFVLLTSLVFLGGLARLTELMLHLEPSASSLFALGMELVVTPALCFWQLYVARRFRGTPQESA